MDDFFSSVEQQRHPELIGNLEKEGNENSN
jgi:hypothetical protein